MSGNGLVIIKRIFAKRFTYFVLAVVMLVILANRFAERRSGGLHSSETNGNLSQTNSPGSEDKADIIFQDLEKTKEDSIVDFALTLQGIPYQYAGKSLKGFDCSGFIYYVFHRFDINIPAGSANQYLVGDPVETKDLAKGDLVFFTGTEKGSVSVGHVGLVISEKGEEIEFVHSSSGGGGRGVTINSLEHPHYKARYLGGRRLENI